ncbi:UNVERIFIED_CONTAM: hypothetical protein Cloal_0595 [Acetivibrio alkalicellulosi]
MLIKIDSDFSTDVIERGTITLINGIEKPYVIRLLNTDDLTDIMILQDSILKNLGLSELAVALTNDELSFILDGNGDSLGTFISGELRACCSLLWNVPDNINMAKELGFDAYSLSQVEQFEMALVHSDLRGHKMQQKLATILIERSKITHQKRYLFTTVSPHNFPSIQTITSLGLNIVKLTKMYNNWNRYIAYKDFSYEQLLDKSQVVEVLNTDYTKQKHLLENGYRGFSLKKDKNNNIIILFSKII